MKFNNLDNTKIFDDFWNKYGESLHFINDIIVKSSNDDLDINNPYGFIPNNIPLTIERYSIPCSRFNFSPKEEFALIAHEFGHAYIQENSIQFSDILEEECNADDYAVNLGLGNELKSALLKIYDNYQDSSDGWYDALPDLRNPKKDLEKRIARL